MILALTRGSREDVEKGLDSENTLIVGSTGYTSGLGV